MCGINGLFLRSGEPVSEPLLQSMTDAMSHRGPDAGNIFVQQNIGLGHRRLKILDLSDAANQPFWNPQKTIGLIYNGEIYNFRELKLELENAGYRFQTTSDTEVLLYAYQHYGEDCFRRLNGIFAFAVLDLRGSQPLLLLVRDRFGIKPLFYAFQDGNLAFASELKPLMQVPWISRDIDSQTLYYFLKFSHVPHPLSIFKDISQVPPGHWLRVEEGKFERHCFWNISEMIPDGSTAELPKTEGDWLAELDEKLTRVVHRQMVSDVPLGCFLSGGIDSSLLTAASVAGNPGKVKTFSIGYQEEEFDETRYAKVVADALGTDHNEYIVSASDFFNLIPDLPQYFDQPFADPTNLPTLLLCKNAREKVTVALSGDGGDELFFGYIYHQILLHLEGYLRVPTGLRRRVVSVLRNVLYPLLSRMGLRGQRITKFLDILQFSSQSECFQYFVGTIGPMRLDRIANLLQDKPSKQCPMFDSIAEEVKGVEWAEQINQVFLRTFLVDTVLQKTDRAGMAFGLELRVPFLDNEMAEFSQQVPFSYKYQNGTKKYILRKLLSKKLPESIAKRKKQGFSIPMREWLRGDLKYLLDDFLGRERLQIEGFFDAQAVGKLVRQHLDKRANHSHLLWSLIMFQLWKEHYQI